jgi:hypothetical protein
MKTYIRFACLLVLLSGVAQADNPARGLIAQCNTAVSGSMPPPAIKCLTYIDGWLDGISGMFTPDDNGNLQTITIEDGVTTLQVAKVFLAYMQNHPEDENKPRQVALWHAMLNAKLVTLVAPAGK